MINICTFLCRALDVAPTTAPLAARERLLLAGSRGGNGSNEEDNGSNTKKNGSKAGGNGSNATPVGREGGVVKPMATGLPQSY